MPFCFHQPAALICCDRKYKRQLSTKYFRRTSLADPVDRVILPFTDKFDVFLLWEREINLSASNIFGRTLFVNKQHRGSFCVFFLSDRDI
ncbi:hypothetical protein J437_LFUL006143 [Ladona fulva]|uniref:Uncharacterized protein n=1 Tax=Ladona fulva TaxID=123851 RepID=A0A8K0K0I4_LADFU|nr:hypothetical protein J437_LFUL006143 [Ladona fulva]